jgi:hypothetical protein
MDLVHLEVHLTVTLGPLFPGTCVSWLLWNLASFLVEAFGRDLGLVPFPGGGRRRDWLLRCMQMF